MTATSYALDMTSSSRSPSRQPLTVLELLLPQTAYACDECGCQIAHGQPRYHCSRCRDYDTCSGCRATSKHAHNDGESQPLWGEVRLWPEPETAPLAEGSSFAAFIDDAMLRFGERRCVGQLSRVDDSSSASWLTFRAMRDRVHACSIGLSRRINIESALSAPSVRFCHCSSQRRPCVAIWAGNCIDWLVADLACLLQHYVVVPIDYSTPDTEALAIMQQMQVSAVFVNSSTLPRFASLAASLPTVHTVIVVNAADLVMATSVPRHSHVAVLSIEALEREGVSSPLDQSSIVVCDARSDCVVSVMYTSGSTGAAGSAAKGVLITDAGFSYRSGSPTRDHDVRLACYLPLSNSTSRSQVMRCLSVGGASGIVQSPSSFLADLAWIQPTTLSCPPRMWNMLHATYKEDIKYALDRIPPLDRASEKVSEEAESVAIGRFRARLGGRVESVSTGGAKSPTELLRFLKRCFGAGRAHDSYGATECGSIARDGILLPGVEAIILDVPSLAFSASDLKGELCVATRNMAAGYTSAATSNAFIQMNGRVYYRTGDVVELRRGNKLRGEWDEVRVLDRVSNVVKLSNGLFVSPETIEQTMEMHCPHIEHLLVHAPIGGESLLAIVVPRTSAPQWSDAEWLKQLVQVAHENKLPNYCKPAGVYVDRSGVSWEASGLLAAQHKKRRAAVLQRYKTQLAKLASQSTEGGLSSEDVEMSHLPEPISLRQRLEAVLLSHLPTHVNRFDACADKSWVEAGGDSMAAIAAAHSTALILPARSLSATQILSAHSLRSLLHSLVNEEGELLPQPSAAFSEIDWHSKCQLPLDMQLLRHIPAGLDQAASSSILLTGATGFLGCFILAELLEKHPMCSVVCIVRAASQEEATSRLARSLSQYSIASSESAALSLLSSRSVHIEVGDAAAEKFGLPIDRYDELAGRITHIVHNASRVNFVLPYAALRHDNVQSTIEILRFCCTDNNRKALCYVSTASTEHCTLNNIGHGHHGGYVQSKFVSEQLVRRAVEQLGVSACVVRPTSIIGDSRRGAGPADPSKDLLSAIWLGIARVDRVHLLEPRPILDTTNRMLTLRDVLPVITSWNSASAGDGDDDSFRLVGVPPEFDLVPVDHVARVVAQSTLSLPASPLPDVSAAVVRACNPQGCTSSLSLLLATDPPLDTPVVVGEEGQRAWRQVVLSDALPPVMQAFRHYLLQPTARWSKANSASRPSPVRGGESDATALFSRTEVAYGESDCPVVDLPLLRRCFQRLNSPR